MTVIMTTMIYDIIYVCCADGCRPTFRAAVQPALSSHSPAPQKNTVGELPEYYHLSKNFHGKTGQSQNEWYIGS